MGEIFITGGTTSNDFPVNNPVQASLNGVQDAYIMKMKNDGSALDFSTYLGGSGGEIATAIAVDAVGAAYVTGLTSSVDFPTISAVQSSIGGSPSSSSIDAFVTKLNTSGTAIIYSTYLGGAATDQGLSIAVDTAANAYVTGVTTSNNFPTMPSPIRLSGPSDAFVTKLGASADLAITLSGAPNPVMIKKELTYSLIAAVAVGGSGRPPAVTAGDGYYQVSELRKGESYIVTPSRQGYVFHPPSREINKLQSDRQANFGAVACAFSLSTTSLSFPATGGIGNVTLKSPDRQCGWTATSNAPWIKLISAPTGKGSAIVSFNVEPTFGSRGGTITIGGLRLKVFQEFNACESVSFNATPRIDLPRDDYGHLMLVNDFNQDSRLDLVILKTTVGSKGFLFIPGASDGKFGSPVSVLSLPEGQGVFSDLAAGDFNSDGALDIVTISNDGPARGECG
jgi:beta-propeller repeat-containing protein/VCBS repeat protein